VVLGEEFEDLASLPDLFVALGAVLVDTFLSHVLGRIRIMSHVVQQALDQMVLETLIAMINKAQQIEVPQRLLASFQLVHGVIANQGGVVGDIFVRNTQTGEEPCPQAIEVVYLLPPADLPLDFPSTEVFSSTVFASLT
jgi:hypothetical protein